MEIWPAAEPSCPFSLSFADRSLRRGRRRAIPRRRDHTAYTLTGRRRYISNEKGCQTDFSIVATRGLACGLQPAHTRGRVWLRAELLSGRQPVGKPADPEDSSHRQGHTPHRDGELPLRFRE